MLLIFHHQSHILQNSGSQVMGQNAVSQSNLKMLYLKKEVNDKVYFWHADKHRSPLQVDLSFWVCATSYAQSTQNKKLAYPEMHVW